MMSAVTEGAGRVKSRVVVCVGLRVGLGRTLTRRLAIAGASQDQRAPQRSEGSQRILCLLSRLPVGVSRKHRIYGGVDDQLRPLARSGYRGGICSRVRVWDRSGDGIAQRGGTGQFDQFEGPVLFWVAHPGSA